MMTTTETIKPEQSHSVERARRFLEGRLQNGTVSRFDVKSFSHGAFWISADVERLDLPTDNLVRFLDHQAWSFEIGPRGKITVHMAPTTYRQFAGRRAFGFLFAKGI
jgi:hypothetical protein